MKKAISLFLIICMVITVMPVAALAESNEDDRTISDAEAAVHLLNQKSDFYYELVENYAKPDIEYRSELRWWMASGAHTDETLEEEVQAIYDAGFRGIELCQLNNSGIDAEIFGYGSEMWDHTLKLVMNKALDLGMTIGLTSGTNWNTSNVPGLDPDSQAASQTVFRLNETLAAGASRSGALPTSNSLRATNRFIGAYAYKYTGEGTGTINTGLATWTNDPYLIDPDVIDLTPLVSQDASGNLTLDWTAPDDADYFLFYFWQQGTAQSSSPAVEPSYCTNYYDIRGFEAMKEYWETNVLNDSELNEKIRNGDVQLFMDSLEYSYGQGFTLWCEDFAEEFIGRKGYDIRPYLVLAVGLPDPKGFSPAVPANGTYNLTDAALGQRILNDLHDVQTQLYMENMLEPMMEWLHGYGIKTRAQISYGRYPENSEPIMAVDYPEAENLNQQNQIDMYRTWSGGSKLQNKVLSSETSAVGNYAYAYDYQTHLQEAYVLYSAGFSRINWHIWTSKWAPTSLSSSFSWPGYRSTSHTGWNVFSNRYPSYDGYAELNDHLGRVQQLLREGESRTDVGMIYHKYGMPIMAPSSLGRHDRLDWMLKHDPMLFPSNELQDNGYTYDYFSPRFLTAEGVEFNSETQTLEQAGYKAIVLWQDWLDVDGAKAILNIAKQGLKVVVVDGAAVQTPFNDSDDSALAATMAELIALSTVKTAATADDVYEALQELGVDPYAGFEENHQLLTQVRQDGGNRYLYVYNYCHDEFCQEGHGTHIQTEIAMDGLFIPYSIDSWSGEIIQLAEYRYEDGKTIFSINLNYGDVALYAFEAIEESDDSLHIISTDADFAYVSEGDLIVRATKSGTYQTALSNGETRQHTMEVPDAYEITDWDITIESWTAGDRMERSEVVLGVEKKEYTFDTQKTDITVQLEALDTWDNIPEVGKVVSGKGYYSATFDWDGSADGAYLDFGGLLETMQLFINGKKTADINVNNPVVNITEYLVDGENDISILYSSNLTNVQLDRGAISATAAGSWQSNWVGYFIDYRSYGPHSATIVPYVEERVLAEYDRLILSTDAYHVEAGDYANITTGFTKPVDSNTAIINYYYDTAMFEQRDFHVANGVDVISRETTDYGAKVMVMVKDYGTQTYGRLALQAKPDAILETGRAIVRAEVEYVVRDEDGEKTINTIAGIGSFTTYGEGDDDESELPRIKGDTNLDDVIDLIDLSNMIDWFGIDDNDSRWDNWYTYFDFNNNGNIDIYDIVYVAQLIK